MVEGGGGSAFPVLFFDGEREMDIGDVHIHPTLEYKPFQHMLSQKIGISPNQITTYLLFRRKNPNSQLEDCRRIPITGKVNFRLICRQKDCCFLVVLKRSKKERNRRERAIDGAAFSDFSPESVSPRMMSPAPKNLILLRRDQHAPFYDQITQSELGVLNNRLENMRIQRENYHMPMPDRDFNSLYSSWGHGLNCYPVLDLNMSPISRIDDQCSVSSEKAMMMKIENQKAFCEECANAETSDSTAWFHHCANDAVIEGFTTRLGPIKRPNKPLL